MALLSWSGTHVSCWAPCVRRSCPRSTRSRFEEPRVDGGNFRAHVGDLRSDLGETDLKLIGRDVVAVLGGPNEPRSGGLGAPATAGAWGGRADSGQRGPRRSD